MLKLAVQYKDKLQEQYIKTLFNDKYKYYYCYSWRNFELKLSDSTWDSIEMVSIDSNDNVIGFFGATINRGSEKVSNLSAINFYDLNWTFSKDFYTFLTMLFEKFNFRKIEFNVVIGNPAEKMYDKYIKKFGGKIIGVSRASVKLDDGKYYHEKFYEIFREDYLKNKIH